MLVWQRPNLLLLDEPTNHLDLATREALSVALNEFEGTVMLVSHDRALLRAVCDEFWLVTRGGIEPFEGDLDDYQKFLLDEARRMKAVASSAPVAEVKPAGKPATSPTVGASLKKLQKELAQLEEQMQKLEAERSALHTVMSQTQVVKELADQGKQLKQIDEQMPALEARWLELTDLLENAAV
jgi:ATP-binding cassette subfamily F protein 3